MVNRRDKQTPLTPGASEGEFRPLLRGASVCIPLADRSARRACRRERDAPAALKKKRKTTSARQPEHHRKRGGSSFKTKAQEGVVCFSNDFTNLNNESFYRNRNIHPLTIEWSPSSIIITHSLLLLFIFNCHFATCCCHQGANFNKI